MKMAIRQICSAVESVWAVWRSSHWLFRILLAAWVLAMISLPIVRWTAGDAPLPAVVSAGVVLQAAAVLTALGSAWGMRRTALTVLAVLVLAWGVEALGSRTGVPFGAYHYTGRLQPQLGSVPLLIPLAWLMMLPPAWAVAERIAGTGQRAAFITAAALAFTVWDLFLDPQMAGWGLWVWERPGGYFGIPWVNYLGWLAASALITLAVRPAPVPQGPLILIYAVTWMLETIGLLVFWGLPGPALVGGAAMGGMLVWAVLAGRPRQDGPAG
jgi:putative membrane protein